MVGSDPANDTGIIHPDGVHTGWVYTLVLWDYLYGMLCCGWLHCKYHYVCALYFKIE